jgi:membrane protein implicated in regulation of membrane protease activity
VEGGGLTPDRYAAQHRNAEPRLGQSNMLKKCVYLLLSFMVGVAGNLIAGWIQQDVWLNAFTPIRIVVTVILACLALLLIARFERGGSLPQRQRDSSGVAERQKVELVESMRKREPRRSETS